MFTVATRVGRRTFSAQDETLMHAIAAMLGEIAGLGYPITDILNIEVSHPDNPQILRGPEVPTVQDWYEKRQQEARSR